MESWGVPGSGLGSARLKLARAAEHLSEFETEVAKFIDPPPYQAVFDGDSDAGPNTFRFEVHKEPPVRLGILAGDVVGGLRQVLDHIVFALAGRTGEEFEVERTQFPIVLREADWPQQAKRWLKSLPAEAVRMIESFQPYHAAVWPETEYLRHINEFSRLDKHRTVAPTWSGLFVSTSVGSIQRFEGPVESGRRLSVHIAPAREPYSMQVGVELGFYVAHTVLGFPVLREFHSFVEGSVLPAFEPFVGDRRSD